MSDIGDPNATTELGGRRAIVTGGTTGIGRAIAVSLAAAGMRVFVCGHDPEHLSDALAAIRASGEGDGMLVDLAIEGEAGRFVTAAKAALGGIDVVIANAGVAAGGVADMDAAALSRAVAVNFTAHLETVHAAVGVMERDGDIVLTGSLSAHSLGAGSSVYSGAKAGIAGFAEALRKELGPRGIRVALIEPGKTEANIHYPDLDDAEQHRRIAAETMLRADDIAVAVRYLLAQPRRVVVQQLTIVPRAIEGE